MNIGIDARMMSPLSSRGIGRYIEELVRAMLAIEPHHRYTLVTRRAIHPFSSHPSVSTVVADIQWYSLAEQVRMPRVLSALNADVVHVPHWNAPIFYRGPLVITVHDLLLRHEANSARVSTRHPAIATIKRWGFRLNIACAMREARKILVPSHFVAQDIATLYPHATSKVIVTGEGMGHGKMRPASGKNSDSEGRETWGSYLFYVGSAYPHKGLDLLLDVWAELEEDYPKLRLKIAGREDIFMRRLKFAAEKRNLHRIDFLGHVDEEMLVKLYREASVFVFPSRFEGFGLPPLEALEAGCSVVSSDATALPEVLGSDGAFFFRAGSKDDMLKAIGKVIRDPESARRKAALALPGLRARHDWRLAAQRTLDAYRSLVT